MLHQVKEALRVKMANNEFVTLVHEATNEDPWGPTGPQMDDIARVFHNGHEEIMEELTLRLKNRKESWRMCYKSMLVLDHLARNVHEASLPIIMTVAPLLRQISTTYTCNEKNIDRGLSVRERARKLADMLTDGALLREERLKAEQTRRKVAGEPISVAGGVSPVPSSVPVARSSAPRTSLKAEQEQADLILAMKLQTEEDRRARASGAPIDHGPVLVGRPVKKQTAPMYPKPTTQEEADHFLALEMQRRIDNGEPMTPTVFEALAFHPTPAPVPVAAAAPQASSSGAKPSQGTTSSTFDDLFAPNNAASPPSTSAVPPPSNTAPRTQSNPSDFASTSLFSNAPPPSTVGAQQPAPAAAFDPFAPQSPPKPHPSQPLQETDFFDNFLAQRKDMHKPTQGATSAPPPPPTNSSDAQGAPQTTDMFELQMQRLSSSTNNNNNVASSARGLTLEDMLRDGKPF